MRGISDQIKETLEKNPDAKFTGFEIGRMAKYYKNRNVSNPATNTEAKNKINYQNYTEQDFETNAKALVSMKSVKDLTGNEFSNKEVPLKERIRSFFASLGNKVKTKEFGEVALNNSSLHDDFGHGLTFNKVVSFDAIPEVLNSGVVIDSQTRGNGNYERIIVAAPITIANEPCYMGVMLQRDFQSQRLYLHDVVTLKQIEALNLSETTPVTTEVSEKSNSLYMTSILQKAVLVNTHSMQNTRTNNNATLGDVEDSTNIHEKNIVEAPLTRANPKDSPRSTNASTIINDTTVTEESQEIKYEMPTVSRDGIDIRSENDSEIQERLATAQDDIERTGILSGASDTTIRIARRLSKVFKVNILFEVSPVRIVGDEKYFENGRYSPEEKTIYINMGSDKSPLVQVISHEFIHSIEGTGLYNRLERYARRFYKKKKGQGGFDTEATKILDEYYEAGKTKYTLAKAQAEVVANYVSTELLKNEENIQRFVAEEHSLAEILRGIIDTVLSVVGNTKAKAEAQTRVKLRRASKLLNEALQSRNTRASTENTIRNKYQELQRQLNDSEITEENFDTLLEQLDEEASAMGIDLQEIISSFSKSDNNSYSIVALENGNVYVKASRNVIQGTTKAEQRKNITDFFNDLLNEKTSLDIHTIEGDVLTITNDTATKARDDYKTVKGQPTKLSDEEFAVKMRAEAHIDEIAETSVKNQKNRKDSKNHPFAKDGFTYRRAYFEDFDGQYYEVTLSVGHNGTVATVYNIGKIQESVSPSAKIIAVVGSKPLSKTLSNTIIRNSAEKSTGNLSLSSNNPDVAPEGTLKTTENIPDSDSFSITKQATNKNQYTDEEYNAYGWAVENNLLNAGQNADYRTKFAQAKTGQVKFNKTKNGELIIPVSDIYDPDFEGVNNVLVFAKGTIDNPVITSIIEIDEYDETSIDKTRRYIYESERRGVQPKIGNVIRRYFPYDFRFKRQGNVLESNEPSGRNREHGRGHNEATSYIKTTKSTGSNKLKNSNGTDSFSITAEKTAEKIVEKKKDNAPIADKTKIVANMSEEERYEVLKDKKIVNIPSVSHIPRKILDNINNQTVILKSWEEINKYFGSKKRTLIQKIASEFGIFKDYNNSDINVEFEFSNNNFRESYSKQGKNYENFAKMFSVFDKVIENAIGVEIHNRNVKGYKTDNTLNNVYVLLGSFVDGDYIYPVKLEIKEFIDKPNKLYVAITLNGIKKTEVWKQGTTENGVAQNSRSVNISIQDIVRNVNIKDTNFLKYIPNQFLNNKQIEAKTQALEEERQKHTKNIDTSTDKNSSDSFSITAEKTAEKILEKKKDNAPIANQLPRDTFGKLKVTEKALRKAIGDVYQIRYARVDVSNTSTSKSEVLVLFTGRIINKLLLTFYLKKCRIK